jgi:hypothetical protein
MPRLNRINPMPVRALAARQQKINRRRSSATVNGAAIAKRLAEMPPFRMRFQIKQPDDFAGG